MRNYTPCTEKKNIPDIFDYNSKKDHQILIIFDNSISDTTGHYVTVQFSTAPTVYFCYSIVGKQNEQNIAFCPISSVQVFPGSAEADVWWGEN